MGIQKPNCIKCAGEHTSANCERKDKTENVKCAQCGGNHPANYKGCIVYKHLQKLKYPQLRNKQSLKAQTENLEAKTLTIYQTTRPKLSYAQSVKRNENSNKSSQNDNPQSIRKPNEMHELMDMLKQIMHQMTTLTNLLLTLTTEVSQNSIL